MAVNHQDTAKAGLTEELAKCRKCRFCLDFCPTYQASQRVESLSSYGRLQALRYLFSGMLKVDDAVIYSIYTCLQCGRCDVVCKSKGQNLEVSKLIRRGRAQLSQRLTDESKNERV